MKNKSLIACLFAIVLAMGTMSLIGADDNVVYATENSVSAVTPAGVDYIVEKHTNISAYRTKISGYYTSPSIEQTDVTNSTNEWVFAGWYTSAECKDTLKKSVVSGEAYAKFVSADVLSVKCQISTDTQPESTSTLLRCISSVDTLKYSYIGFDLVMTDADTSKETAKNMEGSTVGTRIQVTADKTSNPCNYSPKVVDTESEYFYSAVEEITKDNFDDGYLIKPYWITKDGTKVYGVSRYVVINDVLSQKVIYVPVKKSAEPESGTTFTVNGNSAKCKKYDSDGGYVQLRYAVDTSTLGSVTKYTVTGGDKTEATVYYRNLNTKYTGTNTDDQSWYTAYEGTTEDEFVIATNADLYGMSVLANPTNKVAFAGETIYLCADIEANKGNAAPEGWSGETSYPWTSIGNGSGGGVFSGIFDGQGHTISGIYVNEGYRAALFAWTSYGSVLRDFKLTNSYLSGVSYNGSIVGRLAGTIYNIESEAIVVGTSYYNGGLVGFVHAPTNNEALIDNCWFKGSVSSGANSVGGCVGYLNQGSICITNCKVTGEVKGTTANAKYVGGIIGYTGKQVGTTTIKNSYFNGTLDAQAAYAGGVVGTVGAVQETGVDSTVYIEKCYAKGKVTSSSSHVGGIIGCVTYLKAGVVSLVDCLNEANVTGTEWVGGLFGRTHIYSTKVGEIHMTRCLNIGEVTRTKTTADSAKRTGSAVGSTDYNPVLQDVYAVTTSTVSQAYGDESTSDVTTYSLTELTVGNGVTADSIRTKLSGLFGAENSIWTIGTTEGSTPQLNLTK